MRSCPIPYCIQLICGLVLMLGVGEPARAQQSDAAFLMMQALGTHRFDDRPDGGSIRLTRNPADTAGVRTVREHLATIARAFAAGDFSTPGVVHAGKQVPGTATMAARRELISYRFRPLSGGGEVRIRTGDPQALRAIHAFLAFQRREHREHGHD